MGILRKVIGLFAGTGEAAREVQMRRWESEARESEATSRSQRKRAKAVKAAGMDETANDLNRKARENEEHARSIQRQILDSFGASRGRF